MEYPECFGYSLFCDDFRQEVGGKISIMGIYSGSMFLGSPPPTVLPKFGMLLSLCRTPRHIAEHPGNVTLTVHLPGDLEEKPAVVVELPHDQMQMSVEKMTTIKEGLHTHAKLDAYLLIAPFNIPILGSVVANAKLPDGDIIKLGSLIVSAGPTQQPS